MLFTACWHSHFGKLTCKDSLDSTHQDETWGIPDKTNQVRSVLECNIENGLQDSPFKLTRRNMHDDCLSYIILIVIVIGLLFIIPRQLDKMIDNQNVMLCESAKVSGNVEVSKKCKPYYEGRDIKELREVL